jgi:ABC-2 type transport system ATP-binding protein
MADAPDVIIRTDDLTKRYGDSHHPILAVDSLNLAIHRGEIFGLLGPNGAGKTTTIGMLTTRVRPTSGRAFVGAIDVAASPAMAKRVIGVVTQTNTLDRALTVAENLYYHGLYFGMRSKSARRRTDELLELFLLKDRANAEVDELSGGMAQRLLIARALVHDPAVLFLDEPTSGIDPQTRLAIWDIVREVNRRGHTILMTTHYMEEADQLCGRIAIMDRGHVLAQDTPEALKDSIQADTVIDLRIDGDAEVARDAIARLAAVRSVEVRDHRLHILARDQDGVAAAVISTSSAAGINVRDLSINPPSLEAVFIQLTGRELRE